MSEADDQAMAAVYLGGPEHHCIDNQDGCSACAFHRGQQSVLDRIASVGSEVREEWGVDCPIEGFVACDSEHDARAWLVPNGAHHPGHPDVLMRRTTTAWQVADA